MQIITRLKNIMKIKWWYKTKNKESISDNIFTIIAILFAIYLIISGVLYLLNILTISSIVLGVIGIMFLIIAICGSLRD